MHHLPNLPAPPRSVPLSLRIVNHFNVLAQIGWFLFGFGMIFFYFFGTNADISFATFRPDAETRGRVTKIEETGASENERRVEATVYEYSVAGEWFTGKSFTTGGAPSAGSEVTVEYDEAAPARSRIAGMRRAIFGPWALLVLIFPLIGGGIVYASLRTGFRRNHLLRHGVQTTGTLLGSEPTNVTINRRRVWKLTFGFIDRMGQRREAIAKTTNPEALQDEAQEPLLYDPDDPGRAYLLDEAPARPRFEMNGEMQGRPAAALAALVIPTLVIAVNALLLGMKYLR